MKLSTVLVTCLLLATASIAVAADNPAPAPEVTAPVQAQPAVAEQSAPADEVLATPATGCAASTQPLIATGLENAVPASTQFCGTCGSSNCQNVPRGQRCQMGGGQWGTCDFYGGGYGIECPTGNWECYCGTGPLP